MAADFAGMCRFIMVAVAFGFLLVTGWRARRDIAESVGPVALPERLALVLLLMLQAGFFIFLVTPRHVVFTDEALYEQAARNILLHGGFGDLPKSHGWAFLIFLSYLIRGIDCYGSILLAEIIGCLTPIVFFLTTLLITGKRTCAAWGAVLLAFLPMRLFWAATGESHTASLFFVLLAVAASWVFFKRGTSSAFRFSICSWAFAILTRGENMFLFLVLFSAGTVLFLSGEQRRKLPWGEAGFFLALVLAPVLVSGVGHVFSENWAIRNSVSISGGSSIGLGNFLQNLREYGGMFLTDRLHPWLLSILILPGMIVGWQEDRKRQGWLFLWLATLGIVYFSMWLQTYGETKALVAKTDILMFFYPPLVILAVTGLSVLLRRLGDTWRAVAGSLVIFAIVLLSISYTSAYPFDNRDLQLEMKTLSALNGILPRDAAVTACFPEVVAAGAGFRDVVATQALVMDHERRREIFFGHPLYWVEEHAAQHYNQRCGEDAIALQQHIDWNDYWTFRAGKTIYHVYRLKSF